MGGLTLDEWFPIPDETPIDTSKLRIKGVAFRRELNELEAANIAKATLKYLGGRPNHRTAPFSLDWCLRVHREMFDDVWEFAGEIRQIPLSIGVPHWRIREALLNLTRDLEAWAASGMDVFEQSVRLHHRAVQIHPFENGNGRWSRMLANILLAREGLPLVNWPDTIGSVSSPIRPEYISAIKAADNGNYSQIMDLCRRFSASS